MARGGVASPSGRPARADPAAGGDSEEEGELHEETPSSPSTSRPSLPFPPSRSRAGRDGDWRDRRRDLRAAPDDRERRRGERAEGARRGGGGDRRPAWRERERERDERRDVGRRREWDRDESRRRGGDRREPARDADARGARDGRDARASPRRRSRSRSRSRSPRAAGGSRRSWRDDAIAEEDEEDPELEAQLLAAGDGDVWGGGEDAEARLVEARRRERRERLRALAGSAMEVEGGGAGKEAAEAKGVDGRGGEGAKSAGPLPVAGGEPAASPPANGSAALLPRVGSADAADVHAAPANGFSAAADARAAPANGSAAAAVKAPVPAPAPPPSAPPAAGGPSDDEDDLFAVAEAIDEEMRGGSGGGGGGRVGPGSALSRLSAPSSASAPPPASSPSPAAPASVPVAPGLADNWDDAEGYYRYQIGELIAGRFQALSTLGKGVFATVVLARDLGGLPASLRAPGALPPPGAAPDAALKVVRANESMTRAARAEASMLARVAAQDPRRRVVRLLGVSEHRSHAVLAFERMGCDLRALVDRHGRGRGLAGPAVRTLARHVFEALAAASRAGVVHADLKPDNVLVDQACSRAAVADWGSAFLVDDPVHPTPYLASRFYRAPEVVLGLPYGTPVDVWAAACTAFELATGRVLFPGADNNDLLWRILLVMGPFPRRAVRAGAFAPRHFDLADPSVPFVRLVADPGTGGAARRAVRAPPPAARVARLLGDALGDARRNAQFADLLEKCLALDPDRRLTAEEALEHPFFKEPWK